MAVNRTFYPPLDDQIYLTNDLNNNDIADKVISQLPTGVTDL